MIVNEAERCEIKWGKEHLVFLGNAYEGKTYDDKTYIRGGHYVSKG